MSMETKSAFSAQKFGCAFLVRVRAVLEPNENTKSRNVGIGSPQHLTAVKFRFRHCDNATNFAGKEFRVETEFRAQYPSCPDLKKAAWFCFFSQKSASQTAH